MMKNILLWVIAFVITAAVAIYQRATGPTYPISDKIELNDKTIQYKLFRSHGGDTDHEVQIPVEDDAIHAKIFWRRYKFDTAWNVVEMKNENGILSGYLPHQPKAGKLEYYVNLCVEEKITSLPEKGYVVIRFKGDVPIWVLIPHVLAMFGAMLLSMRTGLEIFVKDSRPFKLTYWTIGFLGVGGFFLGPLMQLYAFDAWWTGFPFGTDLTDNKTLIAMVGWLIALFIMKRSQKPKVWAFAASVLLLVVYLIPHSMMGSELDYSKMDNEKQKLEILN
ncbi:MAG: hypothetical protein KKA84_02405 [Bacteroidetes bacterium]|nr:hypothetical protein [Bacteroidota bacterium]